MANYIASKKHAENERLVEYSRKSHYFILLLKQKKCERIKLMNDPKISELK
jgi:hypothetical protein